MNRSTMCRVVVALSLVLAIAACGGRERAAEGTETIAPAQPQPAHTGTDEALTQTVDIEDSRSEAEGAVLTNTAYPQSTSTTGTTAIPTSTVTTTSTAPPPTTTTQ